MPFTTMSAHIYTVVNDLDAEYSNVLEKLDIDRVMFKYVFDNKTRKMKGFIVFLKKEKDGFLEELDEKVLFNLREDYWRMWVRSDQCARVVRLIIENYIVTGIANLANSVKEGPYYLKDENGKVFVFNNLNKFCAYTGTESKYIHKVIKHIRKSHKGWSYVSDSEKSRAQQFMYGLTDIEQVMKEYDRPTKLRGRDDTQAKKYIFINPEGEEVHVFNLNQFCFKHELDGSSMSKLWRGKLKSFKGWRAPSLDVIEEMSVTKVKQVFKFVSPEGKVYETDRLSLFCKEHGLSDGAMRKVWVGQRAYHKGWTKA